jgi:hypothetical protein
MHAMQDIRRADEASGHLTLVFHDAVGEAPQ